MIRKFVLNRVEDESGVSGTGTVAEGVQFSNGWCILSWLTKTWSIGAYPNIDSVVAIHGHNGKTKIVWDDPA